jgi:hypothetical protein
MAQTDATREYVEAAILRIDQKARDLAAPLPEPVSNGALWGIAAVECIMGATIFAAGALFARWFI